MRTVVKMTAAGACAAAFLLALPALAMADGVDPANPAAVAQSLSTPDSSTATAADPSAAAAATVAATVNQAAADAGAPAATGQAPEAGPDGQTVVSDNTADGSSDGTAASATMSSGDSSADSPTAPDASDLGNVGGAVDGGPVADTGSDAAAVTLDVPVSGAPVDSGSTAVYSGVESNNQVAVQPTTDGERAAVVIDDASSPNSYDFVLGGQAASLQQNADGSITILGADGSAIGQLAAPWATDANGNPVPTYYVVNGLTLTQVVEDQSGQYSYPITADPLVVTWTHIGWRFGHSNSEWVFHTLITAGTAGLGGVVCYLMSEVPAVGVACGSIVGSIANEIGRSAAQSALAHNKCVELGAYYWGVPYAKVTSCD